MKIAYLLALFLVVCSLANGRSTQSTRLRNSIRIAGEMVDGGTTLSLRITVIYFGAVFYTQCRLDHERYVGSVWVWGLDDRDRHVLAS